MAVAVGGWAEEQFEHRMGGIEFKHGLHPAVDGADTGFFNQAEAQKLPKLGADGFRIQAEPQGGLARRKRFGGLEEAQTLHADGGKRGPPGDSGMAGNDGKQGG